MKKIITSIILLATVIGFTCHAESHYKGFLNVGGNITKGNTYQYVMGCDKKIGFALSMEHGVVFNIGESNDGIFFGAGVGFDYVNIALDSFDEEEIITKNILSNTVMSIPLYLTVKYICSLENLSMVYAVRGGFYKWYRGHYINEDIIKDYKIPYDKSYMIGFGIGIRLPISDKYGVNLMFNYDYIGANVKWQGSNMTNSKTGVSVGIDF